MIREQYIVPHATFYTKLNFSFNPTLLVLGTILVMSIWIKILKFVILDQIISI